MPDPTFELVANLHLPTEGSEFVDAHGVRDLFDQLIPDARYDFHRGRIHVQQRIDRLRSLGAPEVVYRGETANLDRTICIEVPIAGSSSNLIGYTTGFSYYDGCISFECKPFDVDALKAGSLAVANSLSFDLSLTTQDDLEIGLTVIPNKVPPAEMVSYKFADLVSVSECRPLAAGWREPLRIACEKWLSTHPDSQTASRWASAVGSEVSLFSCIEQRIDSLGDVKLASWVLFDRVFWHHCLVLDFEGWTGLLNLSGHPGPLFDG